MTSLFRIRTTRNHSAWEDSVPDTNPLPTLDGIPDSNHTLPAHTQNHRQKPHDTVQDRNSIPDILGAYHWMVAYFAYFPWGSIAVRNDYSRGYARPTAYFPRDSPNRAPNAFDDAKHRERARKSRNHATGHLPNGFASRVIGDHNHWAIRTSMIATNHATLVHYRDKRQRNSRFWRRATRMYPPTSRFDFRRMLETRSSDRILANSPFPTRNYAVHRRMSIVPSLVLFPWNVHRGAKHDVLYRTNTMGHPNAGRFGLFDANPADPWNSHPLPPGGHSYWKLRHRIPAAPRRMAPEPKAWFLDPSG